tara:strand:+ start:908 stop:1111 length:204 start_codon:yes stop_codon:yes gene_type:complete
MIISAIEKQKMLLSVDSSTILSIAPMLKTTWIVSIPKGNEFQIHYKKDLSWWSRMWMKFIGWGVKKA